MTAKLGASVMTAAEAAARVSELAPTFLEGLAPREVAAVLEAARLRRLWAGAVIAQEGESADEVFLLLGGRAQHFTTTREGDKIVVDSVLPGEISGGRALVQKPMGYLVSTEAVANSLALVWERSAILLLARRYPRLLENALLIASDYLAHYRDLHVAVSHETASERVERVLEKATREIGQKVPGGIELMIRNEELANQANVTVFTVSRLLSEWQRKGLLVKGRGRIVMK
ncbi:Crp/Fnr family transcriptional regulator [Edaphobacter bradus]|uniref:Crp/Fnr family transcriptional regulator n=1 Tax=Edaphobacter bradus TaxID=2259016 RepID=UPI0021DFC5F2|nr:Crp/Fnr family transcriptional regulator [Edaphobacter bradus]